MYPKIRYNTYRLIFLNIVINHSTECFVFDRPMLAYEQSYNSKGIGKENICQSEAGSSGVATFSDTPSTSCDTSQTKSAAGNSYKPKAMKSSGKEKDDNNKST